MAAPTLNPQTWHVQAHSSHVPQERQRSRKEMEEVFFTAEVDSGLKTSQLS